MATAPAVSGRSATAQMHCNVIHIGAFCCKLEPVEDILFLALVEQISNTVAECISLKLNDCHCKIFLK